MICSGSSTGVHDSYGKTFLDCLSGLTTPGGCGIDILTTPATADTVSNMMPLRLALVLRSVGEKSGITYHI